MKPSGVTDSRVPRRARVLAAVVVFLAACASPAASPAAPSLAASPAPTPTTGPTPSATATGQPSLFRLVGSTPVIVRTFVPDRGAVLPGAVAFADGLYHAWVLAFADTPGVQEMHHLTSADAVTWQTVPDASLEALSEGLGNPGAMPTSVFADDDGWVMYYTGTLVTERQGWDIRRATAPGPNGPWTPGAEPVLRRGPAGAWDTGGLDFPTVIRADAGYEMFYSGTNPTRPDGGSIGRATSADGIAWTKHDDPATTDLEGAESDPVMGPGLCGGFDTRATHQPRVVALADRLVMVYAGYAGVMDSRASVGFADSQDRGVTWRCRWPGPALDTAGLPPGFVHTIAAFRRDDRLGILVEWLANGGTDVWLAEAPGDLPGG